jgi:hypothetical protein
MGSAKVSFGTIVSISLSIFQMIPSKIVPQHKGLMLTLFYKLNNQCDPPTLITHEES